LNPYAKRDTHAEFEGTKCNVA